MRASKERGRMCVRAAVCAAVVLTICTAGALAQSPEPKPPQSYQTFYLKNSTGTSTANDIQTDLRNMLPRASMYYVASENALSIRASAEDMATAQKILADIDRPQKSYRVTYTISEGGGQGEARHLVLVVTPGSKTISKQGTRVPIMTGAYKEGEGATANTQFQYQDVGLSIEASLNGFGDGLRLHSKIEQTSVADEKSNVGIEDPIVKQSVLEASSAFVPGKPLILESGDRQMQVQVTVDPLQ